MLLALPDSRDAAYRIRGDQLELAAAYPTVRQPNTVSVDPTTGRLYVAGRTDGRREIVTPRGGG